MFIGGTAAIALQGQEVKLEEGPKSSWEACIAKSLPSVVALKMRCHLCAKAYLLTTASPRAWLQS